MDIQDAMITISVSDFKFFLPASKGFGMIYIQYIVTVAVSPEYLTDALCSHGSFSL